MKTVRVKTPDDILDYDVDFSRWLTPGDTIASVEVAISDGGVAIDDHDFTAQAVKVWLSGGEDRETAHVTVAITTVQGREKTVCFRVRVRSC